MKQSLIKHGDSRAASLGSSGLDLRDIGRDARSIIDRAEAQGRQIIEKARADAAAQCELLRQAAHRAGHEEGVKRGQKTGHEQGLVEARDRFAKDQAELIRTLSATMAEFVARREQLYLLARKDCVVLAIAVASRIFRRLRDCPEEISRTALDAMEEALAMISDASVATIRVHPDDKTAMDQFAAQVSTTPAGPDGRTRGVQIVADPAIARGGVRVETADCTIDADITARLERIADALVNDWRQQMEKLGLTATP
jgi:flagellar assembly protein FliH